MFLARSLTSISLASLAVISISSTAFAQATPPSGSGRGFGTGGGAGAGGAAWFQAARGAAKVTPGSINPGSTVTIPPVQEPGFNYELRKEIDLGAFDALNALAGLQIENEATLGPMFIQDFDRDGFMEIIYNVHFGGRFFTRFVEVYYDFSISEVHLIEHFFVQDVGDVDQDGKIDLLGDYLSPGDMIRYKRVLEQPTTTSYPTLSDHIWDKLIGLEGLINDAVFAGDMDGNGKQELIYDTRPFVDSKIHAFVVEFTPMPEPLDPIATQLSENTNQVGLTGYAIGDLDLDNIPEIFRGAKPEVGSFQFDFLSGQMIFEWQSVESLDSAYTVKFLNDIDRDGLPELGVNSWAASGGMLGGECNLFEMVGPDTYDATTAIDLLTFAADIDSRRVLGEFTRKFAPGLTPKRDLLCTDGDLVRVYEATGDNTYMERWQGTARRGPIAVTQPGFDFDNDGHPEIVVNSEFVSIFSQGKIAIYEHTN